MKKTVGAVVCVIFLSGLILILFPDVLAQAKELTCTFTVIMSLISAKDLACGVKE